MIDEAGQVAGELRAIVHDLDCRVDRTAGIVAEYDEQRCAQHSGGIFQAGKTFVGDEISRDAHDEQIATSGIECKLWPDARIGAAQDAGIGILSPDKRLALRGEIVALHRAFDVTGVSLDETL